MFGMQKSVNDILAQRKRSIGSTLWPHSIGGISGTSSLHNRPSNRCCGMIVRYVNFYVCAVSYGEWLYICEWVEFNVFIAWFVRKEIQLWCNESGQRLRIEIEWRRKWRRISNFVQFLHIGGFASQQWNRQPNQMEPLMLIDASPPSMAAPVVRRQQGSVLHNRDLCRIISAFIPHQFPYWEIVEKW